MLISSGLISGSEVALFSLSKTQLKNKENNNQINIISKLLSTPNKLLATILVANNFINIGIVILFAGILFIARKKQGDRDIEYEKTNKEEPIHNPYGEIDSDLSDGSDHDYEFKDVAII